MHFTIVAIGKLGQGPELDIIKRYQQRISPWSLSIKELESRKKPGREGEARLILEMLKDMHTVIALDERGKSFKSTEFARRIDDFKMQGFSKVAIVIGGADGLDDSVRRKANLLMSFGKLTWPHMLVRAMISEQIYRAWSIQNNHPYHREG